MSKYNIIEVDNEKVLCEFADITVMEELLILPENYLCLYRKDINTGEIVRDETFHHERHVPTLEAVIESKGFKVHTFEECFQLYGELFENDSSYLPFDNNEIYITLDDNYQGCCTRGGYEFTTKEHHYFFGIISKKEEIC